MQRPSVHVILVVVLAVLVTAVTGGVLWASTGSVAAQTQDNATAEPPDRTITVSGHGNADAAPDESVLAVSVVAEGENLSTVRDDLNEGSRSLREALVDANVSEDAVETVEYRISEPPPVFEEPAPDLPAYRGVHAFRVTLSDVNRTGAVVDAVADAGARIERVSFQLSEQERSQTRDRALQLAVEDARRQAETLAAASGLEVVGVHSIDADAGGPIPFGVDQPVLEDATDGTVLQPGDVTVEVAVRVSYEAAPGDGRA